LLRIFIMIFIRALDTPKSIRYPILSGTFFMIGYSDIILISKNISEKFFNFILLTNSSKEINKIYRFLKINTMKK